MPREDDGYDAYYHRRQLPASQYDICRRRQPYYEYRRATVTRAIMAIPY